MTYITLRHFLLATGFFLFTCAMAQVPQKINYQAVARDASGNVIASKNISIRFSVRENSATGNVVYSESHIVATNPYGVFSAVIGSGTVISGSITGIVWSTGDKFLQVEFDPNGGNSYTDMGATQLLSVPFALYSANGTPGPAGATGATGPQGPAGPAGATGAQGAQGPAGATGAQGPQGATGAQGPQGATGAQGPQGLQGPAGSGSISGTTNTVVKFTSSTTAGNSNITDNGTTVGIGQSSPHSQSALDVNGKVRIAGGSPAKGNVLQTDSVGLATWADVANPKVAFSAKADANYTIASGLFLTMLFITEDFDDGNNYSDSMFVCPVSGVYHFDAQINWYPMTTGTGGVNAIQLRVNNTTITESILPNSTAINIYVSNQLSTTVKLTAGDKVTIKVYQNSTATQTLGFTLDNRFSGFRLY
jgi:hypothetical protein